MSLRNYISVSGVSTFYDLKAIAEFCDKEKLNFPVAIGFQISNKSINQGTANSRQPLFEHLKKMEDISRNYGLIPTFHYYTKDNSTIIGDLEKLVSLNPQPDQKLLQFNTLPPSSKTLEKVKKLGFNTIFKVPVSNLSLGRHAVWRKGQEVQDFNFGDVMTLVGMVHERKDFIDYVMFDPSHGIGLLLDLSVNSLAVRFGKEIYEKFPKMGLVYAGGIGPENVSSVVKDLSQHFPKGFSIDTENRVRINDRLDVGLVKKYLTNACEAFRIL